MSGDTIQAFVAFLATLFGFGAALVPLIQGALAIIKTAAGDRIPSAYWPGIAVAVGVALSALLVSLFDKGVTLQMRLAIGLVGGVMASGLYRGAQQANDAANLNQVSLSKYLRAKPK
jgi:hypothetical protein